LRGFSGSDIGDDQVLCVDIHQRRQFITSTQNIAQERDFLRIELEGIAPDALESAMSRFESQLGPVLARLAETGRRPAGEDFVILLNLMALVAVRNPKTRETLKQSQQEVIRQVLSLIVKTPERYEAMKKRYIDSGVDESKAPSYKDVREFVDGKLYQIDVPRTNLIRIELGVMDGLLHALVGRSWRFVRTTQASGPFISGDHPVVLDWTKGGERPALSPGYGLSGTTVTFPLSKNCALVGSFDGVDMDAESSRRTVAMINGQTLRGCKQRVFSPSAHFFYADPFGNVVEGRRLWER